MFDLAAVALSGEVIICLGPASGIEDRAMVSKLAPDEKVYRHIRTSDIGGSLKKKMAGGQVVAFMPTTAAAAKEVDTKFHAFLSARDLLLTGKHFIAPDEDIIRKAFITIVREQDAADPTLGLYREVQAELESALMEVKHQNLLLASKDDVIASKDKLIATTEALVASKDDQLKMYIAKSNDK
jgi:hypothetical protein